MIVRVVPNPVPRYSVQRAWHCASWTGRMNKNHASTSRSCYCGRRKALTILELLVAVAILGLLAALLLPAINEARNAAWRTQCSNNLHQIGLAIEAHDDLHGSLPPGWTLDATGKSAFGWLVYLLPFKEAGGVQAAIDRQLSLNSPANQTACRLVLPTLLCPADIVEPAFALYQETGSHRDGGQRSDIILLWLASCNYLGVFGTNPPDNVPTPSGDGSFVKKLPIRLVELERGLSNTLLVGERTASKCSSAWIGFAVAGEDAAARVVGSVMTAPNRADSDESEFSSRHPGCANFLWADGHVAPISDYVDSETYRKSARRGQDITKQ